MKCDRNRMNCIGNDQVRIGLGKCYVNVKLKKCNRQNIKDYGNEYTGGIDDRSMLPCVDDLPQTVLSQSASENMFLGIC